MIIDEHITGIRVMDGPSTTFEATYQESGVWFCDGAEYSWPTALSEGRMIKALRRALEYSDQYGLRGDGQWNWGEHNPEDPLATELIFQYPWVVGI